MDVENNLRLISDAKAIDEATLCDYSLEDQLKELGNHDFFRYLFTKLITGKKNDSAIAQFTPICKKTVCYIAAAVVFNDKGECLMMQEAKTSCAGLWYIPAGRVEPGEQLIAAVIREVREETGLVFEPLTLITVENAEGNWYRFVFTGSIVGGKLKTGLEADSESLQAAWIANPHDLSLRSNDILPLIEKTKTFWNDTGAFHSSVIPAIKAHNKLLLRIVLIIKKKENNRLHVLVSNKWCTHLPVCEINPNRSIHASIKRFIQVVFVNRIPVHKPHGLFSVEHNGHEMDGICFTILVSCKEPLEQSQLNSDFRWVELSSTLESSLLSRVNQNKTVCLKVIH